MHDDEAWVAAARRGDLDAFNRLVLRYQDQAYRVAYHLLGDPDSAADATQEAFLKAYRALSRFRRGSFRAWLLRIVTNTCYDMLRRRRRRPQVSLDASLEDGRPGEASAWWRDPNPAHDPAHYVERRALAAALETCLEALPPDFRAVAVLVDVEGLDYPTAGQVLGIPVGTVKSRLARARRRLRDCLRRAGWGTPASASALKE